MRPYARVALLAEGVDRNELAKVIRAGLHDVALLAEGVDRNRLCDVLSTQSTESPSSRRAWIEI